MAIDNYGAVIDFIAGINVTQSSKRMKKDVLRLQKQIAGIANVDIGIGVSDAELNRVRSKMKAFAKELSLTGTELTNTNIVPFQIRDEDTNAIKRMATVTSQYKNELGQLVKVTGVMNRETGLFEKELKSTVSATEITETKFRELKAELALSKREIQANVNALKKFGSSEQHKNLDKLNSEVKKLAINSNMTEQQVKEVNNALSVTKREIRLVGTEARAQGKASLAFGEQLKNAVKGFGIWSAVTVAYYKALEAMRKMVTQVKELDDAIVELSKVTNLSSQELDLFSIKASEAGERVNSSASKIIQASASFARMGFNSETSMGLAEDAIILTKIADGITEVSEASTAMISILKGFNMEAEQSRYIIDSINEVSNNFAVNTDDLADGLRRTAGVMKETGVSFEDTIGLLVAGQESLQNIEKVSSGLITISTRLRGVAESGEEIDGLMPKLTTAFKEYAKIDIQKQNGDLKNTKDILTELKPKWAGMNDEQRAYLSFLMSGTRQSPVLLAMMSNLGNGMEASATATESAGSALEEFQKYAESLQGRLDALGATWSRISTDFIDSDFLKGLLSIIDGVSSVVEKIGLLNTVMIFATTIFIGFNGSAMIGLISSLYNFIKVITSSTVAMNIFTQSLLASEVVLTGGLVLALVGLVAVVDALVISEKEHKKALSELNDEFNDTQSEIDSYYNRLEKLTEQEKKHLEILIAKRKELEKQEKLLAKEGAESFVKKIEGSIYSESRSGSGDNALFKYQEALESLGKTFGATSSEVAGFRVEMAEEYEELIKARDTLGSLPPRVQAYVRELEIVLGLYDESTEYWKYQFGVPELQDAIDDIFPTMYSLNDAFKEIRTSGEIGASGLASFALNSEELNDTLGLTQEELVSLGTAWGLSSEEISKFNTQLTDVALEESQNRIEVLKSEIETMESMLSGLSSKYDGLENLGLAGVTSPYSTKVTEMKNALDEIKIIRERYDWDFDGDETKSKTNIEEAYYNQLEKLLALKQELAILDGKASISDNQYYKERIANLTLIKDELHNLNNADRDKLSTLTKGTEEYDSLLATINSRSVEWFSTQSQINGLIQEQVDLAEELAENIAEINDNLLEDYISKLEKSIEDQKSAIEDLIKKNKKFYEDEINGVKAVIDGLKLKKELAEETANILKLQNDLIEAQQKLTNVNKERNTRVLGSDGKWSWVANPSEVLKATEEIEDIQADLTEALNDQKYDATMRSLEQDIAKYEAERDAKEDDYNQKIEMLESYEDRLAETESSSYLTRIEAVKQFVIDYNAEIAKMNLGTSASGTVSTRIPTASTQSFGTSTSAESKAYLSGLKSSTGGDKEAMRQAEITRAKAVIEAREASGESTVDQNIYLDKLNKNMVQFENGGDVNGTGMKLLHNKEGVLTPEMNKAFKTLVSDITGKRLAGADAIGDKSSILSSKGDTIIQKLIIQADSNDTLSGLLASAKTLADTGNI